ncbi:hypothetical protein C2857_002919 [Epichloe festucae Fl1]|uniref:Uncharacterized protein n=1 Tax=Epichloe festucae (strain Fl1) TaxID=877507 RepID=A0A7S9KS06_EPIFF|nr:hypothetical protein C2857_002919 [Epichloe festucae Fl1]
MSLPWRMGSAESKQIDTRLQASSLTKARFPMSFNLYYKSMKTGLKFVIGEHKDQPSHLVSYPGGYHGDAILYSGAAIDSDPLAAVRYGNMMDTYDTVRLPPEALGGEIRKEDIRWRVNKMNVAYSFAVAVGETGYPEKFEWRSSKTDELKELDQMSRGWKLVRLNNGEEIVAVWTYATWSMTKVAAFRFTGIGAFGELGAVFTTMAVMSFIRHYQRELQTK